MNYACIHAIKSSHAEPVLSYIPLFKMPFLPPANEVCEGYVFTGVCLSTGEHAWLLWGVGVCGCSGGGGMCGCSWGACVAKGGMHGEGGTCMAKGGMHGERGAWQRGACVAKGGVCGKGGHVWQRGCAWLLPGWHAWLLLGGVHGCSGGACMVKWGMRGKKGGCAWQGGGHAW